MNPEQIKRREYYGLGTLLGGIVLVFAGIGCLLFSLLVGLLLLGLGAAAAITGLLVLHRIPDVVGQPDELW